MWDITGGLYAPLFGLPSRANTGARRPSGRRPPGGMKGVGHGNTRLLLLDGLPLLRERGEAALEGQVLHALVVLLDEEREAGRLAGLLHLGLDDDLLGLGGQRLLLGGRDGLPLLGERLAALGDGERVEGGVLGGHAHEQTVRGEATHGLGGGLAGGLGAWVECRVSSLSLLGGWGRSGA